MCRFLSLSSVAFGIGKSVVIFLSLILDQWFVILKVSNDEEESILD